jgi:hypothetical protein
VLERQGWRAIGLGPGRDVEVLVVDVVARASSRQIA